MSEMRDCLGLKGLQAQHKCLHESTWPVVQKHISPVAVFQINCS